MNGCIGKVLTVVIDKLGPLFCIGIEGLDLQLAGGDDVAVELEFRHDGFAAEEGDFALRHFDCLLLICRKIKALAEVFPGAGFGKIYFVDGDVGAVVEYHISCPPILLQ